MRPVHVEAVAGAGADGAGQQEQQLGHLGDEETASAGMTGLGERCRTRPLLCDCCWPPVLLPLLRGCCCSQPWLPWVLRRWQERCGRPPADLRGLQAARRSNRDTVWCGWLLHANAGEPGSTAWISAFIHDTGKDLMLSDVAARCVGVGMTVCCRGG